ncbi:hypothetical protein [Enterobacter ludwigii]|uniref:hypothetical protein n=1 Tax=Enterobacter ludwigii TaxID=299767 RepID=UPI003F6E63E4
MSSAPRKAFTITAEQHQYLNHKAVLLTQLLKRPVSSRHILDAFLTLGMDIDEQLLARQLQKDFRRKTRRRVE